MTFTEGFSLVSCKTRKTKMYTSLWAEYAYVTSTDMSRRTEIISERMEQNGSKHYHEVSALSTTPSQINVKNESYISIENSTNIPMEYIFDRADIRGIFITLYTLVFCCCFFGNLLVILVVTLSRRLRSITNFFLANLALADFCVGVFCVFQNLSIYLMPSWVFGDFLCKMYQFIHSLSYTASIFILVVICTERYFAIIHPITCKQILTPTRLRLVIIGVWITSAIYSAPKFIWVQTITNALSDGQLETICISHRKKYDSEVFDMINFALLYVAPLCVMTLLYTRIAVALWRSSRSIERVAMTKAASTPSTPCAAQDCSQHFALVDTQVTNDSGSSSTHVVTTTWRSRGTGNSNNTHLGHLSQNVLRARRGVIRMLIVVVLTFAVCNLPFHARKMWQYWSTNYQGESDFSTLFTPLTFLITYFNSGINPFLYAFLSRNFRKGTRELLFCSCKGKKKQNGNILSNQQSGNQQISMLRRSSTRSTRAPCSSVTHATNAEDT